MKLVYTTLLLSAFAAQAAISISTTAVTNARNAAGTASVASGTLALLIVDTGNNGFFNFGSLANGSTLTASSFDPGLNSTAAGIDIGSTFGGELVINRISTGTGSVAGLLTNFNATPYLNMNFAVVWFDGVTTSATGNVTAGTNWGVVRGSDWTFPASDSGTFTHSGTSFASASVYAQVNANVPAAGTSNFRTTLGDATTGAASFQIVPETSTSLLGAIGALALLRRRRN